MTKIKLFVQYYHGQDNDHAKIEMRAWFGLIRYKKDIPLIKIDEDSPTLVVKENATAGTDEEKTKKETKQFSVEDLLNSIRQFKELLEHVVSFHKIIKHFLKKVSIKKIEWHSVMGVGDAAHTAIFAGAIWSLKGSIIGILSHHFKMEEMPHMTVTPRFQMFISETFFKCMFQFRVGHAMVAGIKLVKYWKRDKPFLKKKPLSETSNQKENSL